ncbi:MAG TPA: MoaD/ThiS family protein [Pyrinomonadaceae bacterium]
MPDIDIKPVRVAEGAGRVRVRVLLFGAAREAAGADELTLDFAAPATARDVFERVTADYPKLRRFGRSLLVAVNQEYARELGGEVKDGDEVAVFPPVSGGAGDAGAGEADDARDFFELTT